MAPLETKEVRTIDEFAQLWGSGETETRLYWRLLGQLGPDDVLLRLPEWLANEKVGYVEGKTPTAFFGRIEDETEKAIRLRIPRRPNPS